MTVSKGSCLAGVSAGKLNLHMVQVTRDQLETVIRDKRSGKVLSFHLQPEFLSKYLDLPEDRQAAAAREVLKLPDSGIFTVQEIAASDHCKLPGAGGTGFQPVQT